MSGEAYLEWCKVLQGFLLEVESLPRVSVGGVLTGHALMEGKDDSAVPMVVIFVSRP